MTDENAIITALMVMFPALAPSIETEGESIEDGKTALDIETLPRAGDSSDPERE